MGCKPLAVEEVSRRLSLRGVKLIGEYHNQNTKTEVGCANNHKWFAVPRSFFIENSGCPYCNNNIPLTNEIVDARFEGTPYKRLGDVYGALHRTRIRCTKDDCGYEWSPKISAILSIIKNGKHRCPQCNDLIRLTNDVVDRRLSGRQILRVGDVSTIPGYCEFKCLKEACLNTWSTITGNVLRGAGCPKCSSGGFHKHNPAVIYVYNIGDKFCGYGISGEFPVRDQTHRKYISRAGYSHNLVGYFETLGTEAARIEIALKRSFVCADSGIPSFRTECTTIENLQKVLDFINAQLKQCQ